MSESWDPLTRPVLLACAGVTSLAMLFASIAFLVRVLRSESPLPAGATAVRDPAAAHVPGPAPAGPSAGSPAANAELVAEAKPAAGPGGFRPPLADAGAGKPAEAAKPAPPAGKRFTLRLGQGFRFRDEAVVAKADDAPDLVFKYLPPQVGMLSTRYNPISKQVETGLEPTLNSPVPLLLATHIRAFDAKPDLTCTTSGDMAEVGHQTPVHTKMRHFLLQTQAGDQYLLTLDELEAPAGRYDDWRIGFAFDKVALPVGLAGGRINKPLPGKLVYRDWVRTKMVVRVDLTTGKEETLADGILPSVVGDNLGFADTSGAYVVRDAAGKPLHNIRFNESVVSPLLSPDGTRLLASVRRPGPPTQVGGLTLAGSAVPAIGVFDLSGKELVSVPGYDDAAWAPDGKIIATGKHSDPGLFEIDPATKAVRAIDAGIPDPHTPSVSPDGKTIAFVTGGRVWLINRDGKDLRQLLPDGRLQQRPVFSPDGGKVAFVICNQTVNDSTGDVFVLDLATRELTPLRTGAGLSVLPDPTTKVNWVP